MHNDLGEIPRMAALVERLGKQHHFSEVDIFAVTVSLEELIVNTIHYGCTDGQKHEITLELSVDADLCRAVLSDDALPYNPFARPEVDTSLPLEEKPIGGLGIHMVKKMMTGFDYEHRDGRNVVSLQYRIKDPKKVLP